MSTSEKGQMSQIVNASTIWVRYELRDRVRNDHITSDPLTSYFFRFKKQPEIARMK